MRVAIVTPYYKEPLSMLRQCHESVMSQTHGVTHFMVADGHPNAEIARVPGVTHVTLPMANGDNGNTPRAIGGLLASGYGYDAVGYLDADNWLAPNHIEVLLQVHEQSRSPLVCSRRIFCSLDGMVMPVTEDEEDKGRHIDTSWWLVMRRAVGL